MKAIVLTDKAAGTAGMKLVDWPEPRAAINDIVVEVHASGFVGTELTWPSTWTDRLGRDRTPTIPGHELAGVVTALGYGTTGCRWDNACSASRTGIETLSAGLALGTLRMRRSGCSLPGFAPQSHDRKAWKGHSPHTLALEMKRVVELGKFQCST